MARFRHRLIPLAVVGVLGSAALTVTPASAQSAQALSPGQEERVSAPGIALRPLADGRVNSYGVSADVPGVAFSSQAGVGDEAVTAAAATQLVVLHLTMSFPPEDLDPSVHVLDTMAVTVASGTVTARLDPQVNLANQVDQYFVVAIPAGGPAVLTVSAGGLSQSLDLRAGRRSGASPTILYRDPSSPEVTVTSDATQTLTATTSDGRSATGKFGIDHATLTYWVPGTTTFATSPDRAYLGLYFDRTNMSIPADGTNITPSPLPGSAVRVQLPDGRTLPTTYAVDGDNITDLLNGVYYLAVPADLASMKVIVDPGSAAPAEASNPGGFGDAGPVTLDVPTALTAQIDFPPAWGAPTFPTAAAPRPANAVPGRAVPRHTGGGGPGVWIALVGALLVAVMTGALILRSQRRYAWVAARPVTWPPRSLPAAATALLGRGRLALPTGTTGRRLRIRRRAAHLVAGEGRSDPIRSADRGRPPTGSAGGGGVAPSYSAAVGSASPGLPSRHPGSPLVCGRARHGHIRPPGP